MRKNSFLSASLAYILLPFHHIARHRERRRGKIEETIEKKEEKIKCWCRLTSVVEPLWDDEKKRSEWNPKTHVTLISSTRRVMRESRAWIVWHWNRKIIIKHQKNIHSTFLHFFLSYSAGSRPITHSTRLLCHHYYYCVAALWHRLLRRFGYLSSCEKGGRGEIALFFWKEENKSFFFSFSILENIFLCVSIVYSTLAW